MKKFFFDPVREGCYHLYFLIAALSSCAYGSFLNVYLGHLGFGIMIIGLFSTIPSLMGMILQPILASWADKARNKRGSMLLMTAISALSIGMIWLLVALWPNPAVILATQLLHGLGYVVYSVAMTRYVADTLPSQIGSTAQNTISLLTMTLPTLAGGVLGGFVIETLGLGYMGCLWCIVALSVLASGLLVRLTVRMPERLEKEK